ncbi:MAG TPA: NAD(P)H-dependent oxidoreductase [Micromonosporaceae bacterium]
MPILTVIVASTRPGRVGRDIADWFVDLAREHGTFEVRVADLAEINLPFLDEPHHPSEGRYVHEHTLRWSGIVAEADAFVFVMPEYNYGYSAPLKNAIDYLYHEWRYKPVGFVSYGMTSAGLRAVQMIKQVVTTLKMMPVTEAVVVPLRQTVGDDGRFTPNPTMSADAAGMLDELARLTEAFATIRASV